MKTYTLAGYFCMSGGADVELVLLVIKLGYQETITQIDIENMQTQSRKLFSSVGNYCDLKVIKITSKKFTG